MNKIYIPKGKAREYSPLALNIYSGCDHNCFYCYVPDMLSAFNKQYNHKDVFEREIKIDRNINEQVLLCFTGDPYCKANDKYKLTGNVLLEMLDKNIPTAILTKGGLRAIQDLDIFKKFPKESFKVGTTLVFDNDKHSLEYESGAAPFSERLETLKTLTENNIQTWVSIEPVLNHKQSINCIIESMPFVSHYKIGKLNHFPEIEKKINWYEFLKDVVEIMRMNNKEFYIKEDLRKFKNGLYLSDTEMNQDYLNVKAFDNGNLF